MCRLFKQCLRENLSDLSSAARRSFFWLYSKSEFFCFVLFLNWEGRLLFSDSLAKFENISILFSFFATFVSFLEKFLCTNRYILVPFQFLTWKGCLWLLNEFILFKKIEIKIWRDGHWLDRAKDKIGLADWSNYY